jgi:hypothetical protein
MNFVKPMNYGLGLKLYWAYKPKSDALRFAIGFGKKDGDNRVCSGRF